MADRALASETIAPEHRSLLLVEGDRTVADRIANTLRQAGYEVIHERDGRAALNAALSYDIDLMLVNLVLPELDGLAVTREVARLRPSMPVIMLTAGHDHDALREGFESGATDYIASPYNADELLARVGTRLRRTRDVVPEIDDIEVSLSGMNLDSDAHALRTDRFEVVLSPKEFDLLQLLTSRPGHLFPREEIMQKVWHQRHLSTSRTLDVHVRQLRVKLELASAGITIWAVRGVGYRLALT